MSNVEAINLKAYFNKGGEELDFTGKRCVLAVSVGQEYHEEQKLSSTAPDQQIRLQPGEGGGGRHLAAPQQARQVAGRGAVGVDSRW